MLYSDRLLADAEQRLGGRTPTDPTVEAFLTASRRAARHRRQLRVAHFWSLVALTTVLVLLNALSSPSESLLYLLIYYVFILPIFLVIRVAWRRLTHRPLFGYAVEQLLAGHIPSDLTFWGHVTLVTFVTTVYLAAIPLIIIVILLVTRVVKWYRRVFRFPDARYGVPTRRP